MAKHGRKDPGIKVKGGLAGLDEAMEMFGSRSAPPPKEVKQPSKPLKNGQPTRPKLASEPKVDTAAPEPSQLERARIEAFKLTIERGYAKHARLLDEIKARLVSDQAGRQDLAQLYDLQERTQALLSDLSAVPLALQAEFRSHLESVHEIQAGIEALTAKLEKARDEYVEPSLDERLDQVVQRLAAESRDFYSQDLFWKNQPDQNVRFGQLAAWVMAGERPTTQELATQLTPLGQKTFLDTAVSLRALEAIRVALAEEMRVLDDQADEQADELKRFEAETTPAGVLAAVAEAEARDRDRQRELAREQVVAGVAMFATAAADALKRESDRALERQPALAPVPSDDWSMRRPAAEVGDGVEDEPTTEETLLPVAAHEDGLIPHADDIESSEPPISLVDVETTFAQAEALLAGDQLDLESLQVMRERVAHTQTELDVADRQTQAQLTSQAITKEFRARFKAAVSRHRNERVSLLRRFDRQIKLHPPELTEADSVTPDLAADVAIDQAAELIELTNDATADTADDDDEPISTNKIIPVGQADVAPLSLRVAPSRVPVLIRPPSLLGRMSQTLSNAVGYIRDGWQRVYREEVLGELAPHELDRSLEVSKTETRLQTVAGVAAGVASTLGVAIIPDLTRWVTQNVAADQDRAVLDEAIGRALKARGAVINGRRVGTEHATDLQPVMLERLEARQNELLMKVDQSRRLTPAQKSVLKAKLQAVIDNFTTHESSERAQASQDIDALLDTHLVSKISGGKVLKEGVNFGLAVGAATGLAGLNLLRGPAYGVHALYERVRQARKEKAPGEQADASVTTLIKEGFTGWWSKLTDAKSLIKDRRQAMGTLVRTLGLGGLTVSGAGAVFDSLTEEFGVNELLEKTLSDAQAYLSELYTRYVSADEFVSLPVPIEHVIGQTFYGEIPVGSRVLGGGQHEGMTQILKRVIEAHPEAYGFEGDSDVGVELFAKRLAVKIADTDGQMRRWLTDQATDKLNLFPELVDGEWHMAAVVDGHKLSMQELADAGYTSQAPAGTK